MITFNKPYLSGNELTYITDAINRQKLSGDGYFTKMCHEYFENRYSFLKVLLTTSCTHALEMTALLLDIQLGDEVIVPSFTFVSTANAFALRGAKIIFADSLSGHPNIDPKQIEKLITPKTKAIVVVHYAGFACDMDAIMKIAGKHQIPVIEDAAQAIDSFYNGQPLGSFGDMAAFSFHDTKNIICGEGGMLVINNKKYIQRAEIIREKGTNRTQFFKGEVDKYGWVDIGSSYLPSEINAAFLYAQLENLEVIQAKRVHIWEKYYNDFKPLADKGKIILPTIPEKSTINGHLFYITCSSMAERDDIIGYLRTEGVYAVFHYLPLHLSSYFQENYHGQELPYSQLYANNIVRLPLYFELSEPEQEAVIQAVYKYFKEDYNKHV